MVLLWCEFGMNIFEERNEAGEEKENFFTFFCQNIWPCQFFFVTLPPI